MKIQVRVNKVYGNDIIYPECETSKKLAHLLSQKTLTPQDISRIQDLGYEVEVIPNTLPLFQTVKPKAPLKRQRAK